jgi:tetratricopeptide (TPR) repeat protein
VTTRFGLLSMCWLVALLGCGAVADEAARQPEHNAEELFELGRLFAVRGDLMRAEQYLLAAGEAGFPRERVLPALINVFVRGSRYRDALAHAEPELARQPDNVRLRTLVASLELALDDDEAAQRQLERVVTEAPEEAFPHYLLGVFHRDRSRDAVRAGEHFARYLALAPDGPHAEEARAFARSVEAAPRLPVEIPLPAEPTEAVEHREPPSD